MPVPHDATCLGNRVSDKYGRPREYEHKHIVQRYYRADVRASTIMTALVHLWIPSREETRTPNNINVSPRVLSG
jgi:hypothetical protein